MTRFGSALLLLFLIGPPALRADPADAYLAQQMQEHSIPGIALNVLRDGRAIKTSAYGQANLEWHVPVTPDTVFEIGSLTKQFTATAIMLLVQQHKVSLDAPLDRYLKNTSETWSGVTVRHLLTHTSGIRSYTGLDGFELTRHLTQEQFIQKLGGLPLEFSPGSAWKYSNSGYNLLGFIIENVSGESYWQFMKQHVFEPLGMNSTTDRNPSVILPRRAAGYEHTNHILVNRDYDLTDVFSAGAIVSTVEDLAKWTRAIDGHKLLTPESQQQMWTPVTYTTGKAGTYGFGWSIGRVDGFRNIGHSGSTSGFSASMQNFPDQHLWIIVLTNTDEQIATTLARGVARFYLPPPKTN